MLVSDPFNPEAMSQNNKVLDNSMSLNGTDTNRQDFWADGSGRFNCFEGNTAGAGTLTFGFDPGTDETMASLYPECPAPAPPDSGTGQPGGDFDQVFDDLVPYVTSDPPCAQETMWTKHSHPAFDSKTPVELTGTCDT
jgi:hypothetical protein